MAYQKNLGKVKGDRGNSFKPTVEMINDQLKITWTEQISNANTPSSSYDMVDIPIYIPRLTNNSDLYFEKQNASTAEASMYLGNIRGAAGADGQMRIRIQNVIDSNVFFDNMKRVDYTYFPNDNSSSFTVDGENNVCFGGEPIREDTLYIANDGQYVYFINITIEGNENQEETQYYTATKLEGISLDNYYTKQETYSRSEMDTMLGQATNYTNWILGLLDIENPENYIDNTTNYYTKDDINSFIDAINERIDTIINDNELGD